MIPVDYAERVYAGVLGKIIGVYLGRPFEGWTYERIMSELGEVRYYVHEQLGKPLVVTDDDISGTFTFLRALPDHGNSPDLTARESGQTWLNYLIDRRTILWWGGVGNSTEHTAYQRLKHGIAAPESGSIATNGKTIAEQIGAQIFIDGWAMVCPGDPERAADFARRAASVSHDGEAIYGAQVVAAMEAAAFGERDLNTLLDTALGLIPRDCVIARAIHDIRDWHAAQPDDWHATRAKIAANYGYDKYGGNCHMVPNHALIIHALLHSDDDFQKAQMIVNTCGWDTDCNAGNVGCLLGIKNGLAAIDAGPDWRGPVADRMYLATADGGRAITDAATETYHVVNIGRALAGEPPVAPKKGARFHFALPGSVQGFQSDNAPDACGVATVENTDGRLAIRYAHLAPGRVARVRTATFIPPEAVGMRKYTLIASPTLYPGQTVRARVQAGDGNNRPVICRLFARVYDADDAPASVYSPEMTLAPGATEPLFWTIPPTGGQPIAEIGLELAAGTRADGVVYLDFLTWGGAPTVELGRPAGGGTLWRQAWVNGVDQFEARWPEPYRIVQNEGTGLISQGTREWQDYTVAVSATPYLAKSFGVGIRAGGMRRYYALLLGPGNTARLVRMRDTPTTLAEVPFPWRYDESYDLRLTVVGNRLTGAINGATLLTAQDTDQPFTGGGVALIVEEGSVGYGAVHVEAGV